MNRTTPRDRNLALRRVRSITIATAAGAGVLALLGAGAAAGTFAGRTVSSDQSNQAAPTQDPNTGLLPPNQPPSLGNGGGGGGNFGPPVTSGGS
jgi:hypothetical protein